MTPLTLKFRLDDLSVEARPFQGDLPQEVVEEAVRGLVGELGYRALGPVRAEGSVYLAGGSDVVVNGTVEVGVGYDCVRCLTAREKHLSLRVDHLISRRKGDPEAELELDAADLDLESPEEHTYEGDEIDLRDVFREDVLLELPMNPTCAEADGAPGCEPLPGEATPAAEADTVDPRWAPLLELKNKMR